ncbi:HAMP domain-containing histidine kinase [bacterium]|nr:HAMP domain-containing histidine kinase [bacterium]
MMETYFATPERNNKKNIDLEVKMISQNPVIDSLLKAVGGLLAVLDEHRQIIALNKTLLSVLDVKNLDDVLGLRPGEALHCIHANEMPGGCGTSKFCSTCGAAISIVTSYAQDRPIERTCAVTVDQKGNKTDLFMSVRAYPIRIKNKRLLLLFLQDITKQQQWANLEQTFFHDMKNILTGLVGASELLTFTPDEDMHELATGVHQLVLRMEQEIKMQQCLTQMDAPGYPTIIQDTSTRQVSKELRQTFQNHPATKKKKLNIIEPESTFFFRSDLTLLMRILGNMITNALEAARANEEIKFWLKTTDKNITFFVWNKQVIPEDIRHRIFQRNFSTKQELGRGLGTYSMKLFGEQFLGGSVDFTSSENEGTTFWLKLPV